MAEHKPTPEEQLLKLIENPQTKAEQPKKAAKPPAPVKTATKKKTASGFDFKSAFGSFFAKGAGTQPEKKAIAVMEASPGIQLSVNVKTVNHVLIALVIASGIYLMLDLFVFKTDEDAYLAHVGVTDRLFPVLEMDSDSAAQDVTYYKQPLERRNPFLSSSAEPLIEETGEVVPLPASSSAAVKSEVLNSLKLVGISFSKDRLVAMVEDSETGKTHFLRVGQEVRGVKVQAISSEKVIVTYEGEEGVLF